MSLRHAFRSKFRSGGDKDSSTDVKAAGPSSTSGSPWHSQDDVSTTSQDASHKSEETTDMETSPSRKRQLFNENQQESLESKMAFRDHEEKGIYEHQLTQLQEQLVASMIENQSLATELEEYKEKHEVDKIRQELEYEKQRTKELASQLSRQKRKRKPSDRSEKSDTEGDYGGEGWVDLAQEATEDFKILTDACSSRKRSLKDRLHEWLVFTFYELLSDFSEEADTEEQEDTEGETLTVKKLKENIKRFKNSAKPIVNTFKGIYRIFTWKNPSVTLIVFCVYMYSVWQGWLVPLLLFLALFQLSINYLCHIGWNVNIKLLADPEDDEKNKDSEGFRDRMSDKFNLVVQVARQVQNTLGKVADNLEKVKNLLMWKQPSSTRQVFLMVLVAFILSCFLPGTTLFTLLGLHFGIKMFLIEYVYHRFPRFKQRHDGTYKMWMSLPTDSDLETRYHKAAIDRSVLPVPSDDTIPDQSVTQNDRSFCELHSLPPSEFPLPGWQGGRRCTFINKDKSLTSAFKHGKLYLTRSFLCFERSKSAASKNLNIPLTNIIKLEKAKPYTWMPGAGMSIEITLKDQERPLLFGAMLNRDELFESILSYGMKASLSWATKTCTPQASTASTTTLGAVATDNKPSSSGTRTPSPKSSPNKTTGGSTADPKPTD